MKQTNDRFVVEIPSRALAKPSIDIEMNDTDIAASSEAECNTTTSVAEVSELVSAPNKDPPLIQELLTEPDVKESELLESMIASESFENTSVDAQPQALNVFLDLISDPPDAYKQTADTETYVSERFSSNSSTGDYLLGVPGVTKEVNQNSSQTKDGNVDVSDDLRSVGQSVKTSTAEQAKPSPSSMDNDNSGPLAALITPALYAGKIDPGSRATTDGQNEGAKVVLMEVSSRVPDDAVLENLAREDKSESAVEFKNNGSNNRVPSKIWGAEEPASMFHQNPSNFAGQDMNKRDLKTKYHSSAPFNRNLSSGVSTKQSANPPILTQHHQAGTTSNSGIAMADILKLAEDKPKIKSRFKPKAPTRVTERHSSLSTPLASRPNMTTSNLERSNAQSYPPKRSPSSPAGGESSMKKLRPEEGSPL